MIYLDNDTVEKLKPDWNTSVGIIRKALACMNDRDYSQPIKPYLRFKNPSNRIIAMPSYIGGSFNSAGIKWIASFPENHTKKLPRAHSLTVLNDAHTGKPISIMQSSFLSALRTAAVSAGVISEFLSAFPKKLLNVGISGFGKIGRMHLEMLLEMAPDQIRSIKIFDCAAVKSCDSLLVKFVDSWEDAYVDADLFLTCTTTLSPYINLPPKTGSLHLNVSLRDYAPEIVKACKHLFVDNWDEVCREGTDIERAHLTLKLDKSDTLAIDEMCLKHYFHSLDQSAFEAEEYAMLHPMGLAIFDISVANYFYNAAINSNSGTKLTE